MSSGTLYIMPVSPRSNWLGALAKSLNLDIDVVDCTKSEQFAVDFPLKKSPAFVDQDGWKLTEILAIVEYLFSLSKDQTLRGKTGKDKAQVMRWLSFVNQDVAGPCIKYLFIAKSQEEKDEAKATLVKLLTYIDEELASSTWLAVDGYITVADEYLFSWYGAFGAVVGGITAEKYPHLAKWHEAMKSNDAIAKALSN